MSIMMTMTPARKTHAYERGGRKFIDVAIARNNNEKAHATARALTSDVTCGKLVSGLKTTTSEIK